MKKIAENKSIIIIIGIFLIYSIVHSCSMIMTGDDFTWVFVYDLSNIFSFSALNGRYFTNLLTNLMVNYPAFRIVSMTIFTFIFPFIISKMIDKGKNRTINFSVAVISVIAIPSDILVLTLNWISGFTNYIISAELTFLYILFCMPLLRGKTLEKSPIWAVYTAVIGFLGALCVENITIYNICFGLFIAVYSLCKYKKLHIANISYFIFSAAGAALMFLNQTYSSIIVSDNDEHGWRSVEFGASDIFRRIFVDIIPMYARKFYIFHIIIAVSILVLYYKKYGGIDNKKQPKYAKLFIPVIVIYAVYTLFSVVSGELESLTTARRFEALETAFTFLYIVGLLYIFYSLGSPSDSIIRSLYLISTVVVTAPFTVVSPVTERCFYASYVFWGLLAGELVMSALNGISVPKLLKSAVVMVGGCLCIFFSYALASNKYIDVIRINALKEQMDNNSRLIETVELPYPQVSSEYIGVFFEKDSQQYDSVLGNLGGYWLQGIMCDYYGIDKSIVNKEHFYSKPYDFY